MSFYKSSPHLCDPARQSQDCRAEGTGEKHHSEFSIGAHRQGKPARQSFQIIASLFDRQDENDAELIFDVGQPEAITARRSSRPGNQTASFLPPRQREGHQAKRCHAGSHEGSGTR